MKTSQFINIFIFGLMLLLLYSCSSTQKMMKEPKAFIKYEKAEFDYSEQVSGKTSSVKILGVNWQQLFNMNQGKVTYPIFSVYGLLPNSKEESYALYNLFQNNPGYDLIVYPQYEVTKISPIGIGLFYKKIETVAKARLAVNNDTYINENDNKVASKPIYIEKTVYVEKPTNTNTTTNGTLTEKSTKTDNAPELKETEKTTSVEKTTSTEEPEKSYELARLQHTCDSLENEIINIYNDCAREKADLSQQIINARKANEALKTENKTQKATSTPTPKTDSNGTYTLIIGSYSNTENAQKAINIFDTTYPELKGNIKTIIGNGKYRVGFTNFTSRDDAMSFKKELIKSHSEFKSAWPYNAQ